jgi:hypothetical protein
VHEEDGGEGDGQEEGEITIPAWGHVRGALEIRCRAPPGCYALIAGSEASVLSG